MITHYNNLWRFSVCTVILLCHSACDSRPILQASDFLPASNEVVTAYGMTLDENATPAQSAWVLLMAARDDSRTTIHSPQWQALMKLQCRLADVELLREVAAGNDSLSRVKADEIFFRMIRTWASALNYYAEFFDQDFETAATCMTLRSAVDSRLPQGREDIQVVDYVLTAGAPGRPAALDSGDTIQLLLSKPHKGYWRVYKIQFAPPPAPAAPGAEFGAPS